MKNILILFLLVQSTAFALDLPDNFHLVKDLTETCYFNKNNEALPYVKGNGLNPDAIHFYFNPERYSGNQLLFSHTNPFAIFIEGELKNFSGDKTWIIWDIDSLLNVLEKEVVLISVFAKDKNYDGFSITVVKELLINKSNIDIYSVETKKEYRKSVYFVILLILAVYSAVILNTNQKSFKDFYSLNQLLFGRVKDENLYKSKLFSQDNLIIYLFHSSLMAFLFLQSENFLKVKMGFDFIYFDSLLTKWLIYTFLIFFFFLIKYLLIRYLGVLFDLGSAANFYFYEFMRISMIFFLGLFFLSAVMAISFPYAIDLIVETCIFVTLFFMVIRFLILFIRIGKIASFKKIHLFSYLCTTESIPILIGLKYLIF